MNEITAKYFSPVFSVLQKVSANPQKDKLFFKNLLESISEVVEK